MADFRETLRRLIAETSTPAGRAVDTVIYVLIVASMVLFALETLPELRPHAAFFQAAEWTIVLVFTVEYAIRLAVSRPWTRYAFSFYGVVDLLSILPTYLSLGALDLRSLRALRLVRLFRVAKLGRYNRALQNLRQAFRRTSGELLVYFGLILILLYLSASGIYFCEREAQPEAFGSVFHALWWAVATLSTVGYGDIYPVTVGGRLFTFFVLLMGLSVVSVPSGLLAAALVQNEEDRNSGTG